MLLHIIHSLTLAFSMPILIAINDASAYNYKVRCSPRNGAIMEYITIKEASEKWGISVRRVQAICNNGLIPDAKRFGHAWAIPENAEKPADKRVKTGKYIKS